MQSNLLRSLTAALALALALGIGPPVEAQEPAAGAQTDAPTYVGRAFVFQADFDFARRAGWVAPGTSDDELSQAIHDTLATRLRRTGRFVEARVLVEPEDRFAVVFVGRQDPRIEDFLTEGLSFPGRLAVRVVAADADLDQGATIASERERLARWSAAHTGTSVATFRTVPRADGGPHPALEWMLPRGVDDVAAAVPLLVGERFPIATPDVPVGKFGVVQQPGGDAKDPRVALAFELKEEAAQRFAAFGAAHAARRCVVAVDDRIVDARDDSASLFVAPYTIRTGWSIDDARPRLMAISGGPLDAPLRFVEFSTRELAHVAPAHTTD